VPESVIFQQSTYYYGLRLDVFASNGAEDSPLSRLFGNSFILLGDQSNDLQLFAPILSSMQKPINMCLKSKPPKLLLLLNPSSFTETGRLDTSVLRWWNESQRLVSLPTLSSDPNRQSPLQRQRPPREKASATYITYRIFLQPLYFPSQNQR